jgi:hypothetical protein
MCRGYRNGLSVRVMKFLLAFAALGIHGTADVPAGEIRIIANPNLQASELSRDELNRIFLIITTSLPGAGHVEPVLEKAGATSDLFMKEYMGRTNVALMTYYRALMFSGKASIPKRFDSDLAVAEYVAKTKGAIGYVSLNAKTAGVKIMQVK